ncbi:PKD domain-containing protein, partial [Corallococcus sp. CA054B]|uniref:PKD domain-containing protein n=1 Tax=Corallococcus sp. CA054B TaxID=2316734 RepID=UPI001F2083BC
MNRPHPFQSLALLPLLLMTLAACAPAPAPSQEGSADIAVSAQALSTSDVARVTLTVSAADLSADIVANLQNTGGQWRAVLGAIPAGANRTFRAQAFDSSDTQVYEGQATGVTITSSATAAVVIVLQQTTAPTPFVNSAPRITGLTASTSRVDVNESVTLAVTDTDADGDARSYAWTASGGTFVDATTASPTWTAPATEGTYSLNVSVTDGKGGQAGISLKVAVVRARGSADVAVAFNTWPVATLVTGTPSGQVAPGGVVSLDVAAVDADNDVLSYSWADDCGGSFSADTQQRPTWTAPATAPASAVCKVTVSLNDGRGGSTTGQLGINVGLPQIPTRPPVIDELFQSTDTVAVNGTVKLVVSAYDPEGAALTFTWSASGGTLGTPVTSASRSEVNWTAPSLGVSSLITLVIQDASGQKTTQTFSINLTGGTVTCVKVVTSYLKKANPYGYPVTVNYSMVGGAGGGMGYNFRGSNGATASTAHHAVVHGDG